MLSALFESLAAGDASRYAASAIGGGVI